MELDELLIEWINLIPKKEILNIILDSKLIERYNKLTKLNYIISFDVEFIRYAIEKRQVQTIHEMGGIILFRKKNIWYLICIFHFNLIPIIKNIKQYYLLTSKYNTVSNKTYQKLIENEKKILPENNISNILNNKIIKRYLSNKKIKLLIKNNDPVTLLKKLSKIKYMIKGYDLDETEYILFKNNIDLILNDPILKSREIKQENQKKFIKVTNILFSKAYLIIKGLEDIKALRNHSLMLNEVSLKLINYFDIAIYNNYFFKNCNSAELEKSYLYLDKLNLTKPYEKYLEKIKIFSELKAHNPLIDAYYTWIIFNINITNITNN
jgi:hypothetical protein